MNGFRIFVPHADGVLVLDMDVATARLAQTQLAAGLEVAEAVQTSAQREAA